MMLGLVPQTAGKLDRPRRNAVHPYVVWRHVLGVGLCHLYDGGFYRPIGSGACRSANARDR